MHDQKTTSIPQLNVAAASVSQDIVDGTDGDPVYFKEIMSFDLNSDENAEDGKNDATEVFSTIMDLNMVILSIYQDFDLREDILMELEDQVEDLV